MAQEMIAASYHEAGHKQIEMKKEKPDDDFVSLDIATLSLLSATEKESSTSTRILLQKTLTRKGSQRVGGGEKKAAEVEPSRVCTGGPEKPTIQIHVAVDGDSSTVPHATTPTGRCRRVAGRRASPCLHPRRVLLFFATLSSMGTLILLYFTLSMGKMAGNAADAR